MEISEKPAYFVFNAVAAGYVQAAPTLVRADTVAEFAVGHSDSGIPLARIALNGDDSWIFIAACSELPDHDSVERAMGFSGDAVANDALVILPDGNHNCRVVTVDAQGELVGQPRGGVSTEDMMGLLQRKGHRMIRFPAPRGV